MYSSGRLMQGPAFARAASCRTLTRCYARKATQNARRIKIDNGELDYSFVTARNFDLFLQRTGSVGVSPYEHPNSVLTEFNELVNGERYILRPVETPPLSQQVSNHEGGLNNQATALEQRGGQRLKGKMTAEYGAVELFHNVELTFSSKDEEGTLSQSVRQYDVMAFASGGCLIALEAKMSGTDRDVTKFSTAMSHARQFTTKGKLAKVNGVESSDLVSKLQMVSQVTGVFLTSHIRCEFAEDIQMAVADAHDVFGNTIHLWTESGSDICTEGSSLLPNPYAQLPLCP